MSTIIKANFTDHKIIELYEKLEEVIYNKNNNLSIAAILGVLELMKQDIINSAYED